MRVVIEAGHGGRDSGAVGPNNRYEKDDNLRMALAVRKEFIRNGIEVTLTRSEDVYISNTEKCAVEKATVADCCIAFHRNGSNNESANGFEIWVHSSAGQKILDWGNAICKKVATTSMKIRGAGTNKGVSGDPTLNYYWNNGTRSPSMLIEFGFISNVWDNKLLDDNFDFYVQSIVRATCDYLGASYKEPGNSNSTPSTNPPTNNSYDEIFKEKNMEEFFDEFDKLLGELEKLSEKYK